MLRQSLPQAGDAPRSRRASEWIVRAFPWHLRGFLALNLALTAINALVGTYWWAFWPLVATGFVLTVHYLFYKTTAVDERWVDERVQELNLKSYDRSHIEDLKRRHGGRPNTPALSKGD